MQVCRLDLNVTLDGPSAFPRETCMTRGPGSSEMIVDRTIMRIDRYLARTRYTTSAETHVPTHILRLYDVWPHTRTIVSSSSSLHRIALPRHVIAAGRRHSTSRSIDLMICGVVTDDELSLSTLLHRVSSSVFPHMIGDFNVCMGNVATSRVKEDSVEAFWGSPFGYFNTRNLWNLRDDARAGVGPGSYGVVTLSDFLTVAWDWGRRRGAQAVGTELTLLAPRFNLRPIDPSRHQEST